jgi:hypothetical protein
MANAKPAPWDLSTYTLVDSSYTDGRGQTGMFSTEMIDEAARTVAERRGYEIGRQELEHRVLRPQITKRDFWPPRIHKKLPAEKKAITHRRIRMNNPITNDASSVVYGAISDQLGEIYFRTDKGSESESRKLLAELCQELLTLEIERTYGKKRK